MCTIIRVSRGMIVVAIEIGAVEIDIVDSDRAIQFVIVERRAGQRRARVRKRGEKRGMICLVAIGDGVSERMEVG
jgi:hypothetical protein